MAAESPESESSIARIMMPSGAKAPALPERILQMAKVVDYYLSPTSPWTYLGHARFSAMLGRYGAQVNVKPVDYGKIFPVSGGLPLKQRAPQRQAYRMVELRRFRDYLGVPLNLEPKFFPVPTDEQRRVIAADQAQGA